MTVRRARAPDLDELVRLAVAFRDHLGQSTPSEKSFRASITQLLSDAGTEFFIASDAHGTSIGYAQVRYRYSAWTAALDAEIEDLFVRRDAWRQGVGRQLVECVITRAAAKGCRMMGLNTNERNENALALYVRLGFVADRALWSGARQLWLQKVIRED